MFGRVPSYEELGLLVVQPMTINMFETPSIKKMGVLTQIIVRMCEGVLLIRDIRFMLDESGYFIDHPKVAGFGNENSDIRSEITITEDDIVILPSPTSISWPEVKGKRKNVKKGNQKNVKKV